MRMNTMRQWMVAAIMAAMAVLLMSVAARASDDGSEFGIKEVAEIDADRSLPKFTVEQVADHRHDADANRSKGREYYLIQWKLADGRAVTVGRQVTFPAVTGERKFTGFDGVDPRTVAVGWLKGAKDLLVIAATDKTVPPGTGLYVARRYMIVRLADGELTVLLRQGALIFGANRHVRDGGVNFAFYQFDPATQTLRETIKQHAWPISNESRPLFHLTTETDDEGTSHALVADIHERVVHEMDYREGKLTSRSIKLFYTVQKRDTLWDIAAHYLGPFAPASVIADTNPQLPASKPGEVLYPSAGTEVRIPVPEKWLRDEFLRDVSAYE